VASLRVAGTLHGDRLDEAGLSAADRAEIERKLRSEVLTVRDVVARGRGTSRERADLTVTAHVSPVTVPTTFAVRDGDTGRFSVTGRAQVSLRALGVAEVKGPLGAFKLEDAVEVFYDLELA
jgi:hypothetical protein